MPRAFLRSRFASRSVVSLACLSLTAACFLVSGCKVSVDKSDNGKDKNVQIETPFGGLHVRSDQTTAASLGLSAYPGAQIVSDNDGDKSADVSMGFGEWQLRVKVVHYKTSDPRDKVVAYYRKALEQYGDVIACNGNHAVGEPTVTSEGLTCDENHGHAKIDLHDAESRFNLRAGSRRHQRIVGFGDTSSSGTQFTLVELVLPQDLDRKNAKED